MKWFTQSLTIMGEVTDVNPETASFTVACRSGDKFTAYITRQTEFRVLQNLDGINNDRVPNPDAYVDDLAGRVKKYVSTDQLITVQGVLQLWGGQERFDARTVYLLSSVKDCYLFEETHWWLTQT